MKVLSIIFQYLVDRNQCYKPYLMYTIAKLTDCRAGAAGHDFISSRRVVLNILFLY